MHFLCLWVIEFLKATWIGEFKDVWGTQKRNQCNGLKGINIFYKYFINYFRITCIISNKNFFPYICIYWLQIFLLFCFQNISCEKIITTYISLTDYFYNLLTKHFFFSYLPFLVAHLLLKEVLFFCLFYL